MQIMRTVADKYFDLAIVDPPYGINKITGKEVSHGRGKLKHRTFNKGADKFNAWDIPPTQEYFDELFRISKNQIIWGGNYFDLPKYRCVIVWDKCQPFPNFSAVEIAWSSFNMPASIFRFDNRTNDKIHPTQKPVALYKWLLSKYAKRGDKILDTHLGSMSIAIACYDLGFDLTGCEIDDYYFEVGLSRLQEHSKQADMFRPPAKIFVKRNDKVTDSLTSS